MNSKYITYDFRNAGVEKQLQHLLDNALIFDTETSGLSGNNSNPKDNKEIVELALINPDGTTLYHSLFKPEKPISETLSIVNNITNEKLENAPKWKDEWPKIKEFMNGKNIVGFNNESFDNQALEETCRRYGIDFKKECSFNTKDVMPLFLKFTNLFPLTYNPTMMIKQEVARNILDLTSIQTHRADDDCRDLLQLINEMKRRIASKEPVKAEKFLQELPKIKMKKKYSTLLEKERRTQEMFNDLKKNVPIERIQKEYSDLGSPIVLENKIIKMAKKGILDIDSQVEVSDKMREKIYEHYKKYGDIGKAAIDLGVNTLKVRNIVIADMTYSEKEATPTKSEILENLSKDEVKTLNEYANKKIELDIAKQELELYENQFKNIYDDKVQMADETLSNEFIQVQFKVGGNIKEVFDTETFKRECPELYKEYLKVDKDNNVVKTTQRETLRFKPNKEYLLNDIMNKDIHSEEGKMIQSKYPKEAENVIKNTMYKTISKIGSLDYSLKIRNIIDDIALLTKEIKSMDSEVKEILSNHNCNEIATKLGSFRYSISQPGYTLDQKRLKAELPDLRSQYVKSEVTNDSVTIKKAPSKQGDNIDLNYWFQDNIKYMKDDFSKNFNDFDKDLMEIS